MRTVNGDGGKTVVFVGKAYFQAKSGRRYPLYGFDSIEQDLVWLDEADIIDVGGSLVQPGREVAVYTGGNGTEYAVYGNDE